MGRPEQAAQVAHVRIRRDRRRLSLKIRQLLRNAGRDVHHEAVLGHDALGRRLKINVRRRG
jgi:ribosomal protein S1